MTRKKCEAENKSGGKKHKELKYFCKSCRQGSDKEKHLCKPKKS